MPLNDRQTHDDAGNPLLWAILETREAVVREFEAVRALLREQRPAPAAPVAAEPAAPAPAATDVEPAPEPEPRPLRPPGRPMAVDPSPTPVPGPISAPPARATSTPAARESAVAEPAATPGDARQRLDALARLLDKRARQTAGEAPARNLDH